MRQDSPGAAVAMMSDNGKLLYCPWLHEGNRILYLINVFIYILVSTGSVVVQHFDTAENKM